MAKKKNAGLGRGLDAIFLDNSDLAEEKAKEGVSKIRISMVDPKSDQPRKYFDREALEELAESIKEHGLLQPILVREIADDTCNISSCKVPVKYGRTQLFCDPRSACASCKVPVKYGRTQLFFFPEAGYIGCKVPVKYGRTQLFGG